jgi:hypothetical protein
VSTEKINPEAAHAFTVALLEEFYETKGKGRVTDETILKLRGTDEFIDNDEFVFAFEENVWTEENSEKFGDVHNDGAGYYLSDGDDED